MAHSRHWGVVVPRSDNWLNDDVHGTATGDGTIFPNGVTLGMSWDSELLHTVGAAVGLEARGGHNGFVHAGNRGSGMWTNGVGITLYAPNMNLVRDPRWGRAQEVYSEDVKLTAALTLGFVRGAQGDSAEGVPQQKERLTFACCKHLAAYDLEDFAGGVPPNNWVVDRVHFDANVTSRNMWETYLPTFESCLREAKAGSVMCSFNSINVRALSLVNCAPVPPRARANAVCHCPLCHGGPSAACHLRRGCTRRSVAVAVGARGPGMDMITFSACDKHGP